MNSGVPTIILEFNELTPSLMWRFMSEGRLPNFSRLYKESHTFLTDAGEDPPWLEPWIQWVTVHTGIPAQEHGIFNLGDSANIKQPAIWDIVSEQGHPVWVCGSMNAFYKSGIRGQILPDPWSVRVRPTPDRLNPYFDFVRGQVMEYTRTKSSYETNEALRFALFMARNGLTLSTTLAIVRQLMDERVGPARWRRATILDRMQYDLFESNYRRLRPRLATFFLNSTAHLQHVYWRNLEPQKFSVTPSQAEQDAYANAVLYGYERMDEIVGKAIALAGGEAAIIFLTALSQQPCLKYEGQGGKRFYKPISYKKVLDAMGIDAATCEPQPVMSEQFHLRFRNADSAKSAYDRLCTAKVDGRPAFASSLDGISVMTGCAITQELPPDALLSTADQAVVFNSVFYLVDLKKSGMHHRDGMAWFRLPDRGHSESRDPVPLVDVAPTILSVLGIEKPAYMTGRVMDIYDIGSISGSRAAAIA
jgi:Type I phosphodiesterase / nucleotide pyrophosphatase